MELPNPMAFSHMWLLKINSSKLKGNKMRGLCTCQTCHRSTIQWHHSGDHRKCIYYRRAVLKSSVEKEKKKKSRTTNDPVGDKPQVTGDGAFPSSGRGIHIALHGHRSPWKGIFTHTQNWTSINWKYTEHSLSTISKMKLIHQKNNFQISFIFGS